MSLGDTMNWIHKTTLGNKENRQSNKTQNHNPANQRTTLSPFGGLRYLMHLAILRFFAPWAYHTVTTLIYRYCFPHVSRRRILHFWIRVLTLIFRKSSPSFSWSPNVDRVFTFGTPLSGRARNALSANLFLFWIVGSGRAERQKEKVSVRTWVSPYQLLYQRERFRWFHQRERFCW